MPVSQLLLLCEGPMMTYQRLRFAAKEGGPIEKRSRKAVPVMEIYSLNVELSKQLQKD